MADQPEAKLPPAVLIVTAGEDLGRAFSLNEGETLLGRSSECGVRLGDPKVSRVHASIVCSQGLFVIDPRREQNPTYLRGEALTELAELEDRDVLSIGQTQLCIVLLG